jgi:ribosome-binding protein aMBF1 (putative translation factor)
MNKPRKYSSRILEKVAKRISGELSDQNDRRMGIALKIADTLHLRGLSNQEFAFMMGKKTSEVSRWLSGTHNFTTETLWQIERVLKIQLLTSSPIEPHQEHQINELTNFVTAEVQKAITTFLAGKKLAI